MKIIAIYDNGGKTLDRYTVVTDIENSGFHHQMLGLNEGGDGFSQWTMGVYYDKNNGHGNRHLGKRVQFENLSEATQRHIAERVFL